MRPGPPSAKIEGRAGPPARRGFLGRDDGVAVVEFALLAPALILLLIGCVEVAHFANNVRKVGFLARAIGDIASHSESLDAEASREMFGAAALILSPFDGAAAKIRLSTVGNASKEGTVQVKVCSTTATANAVPRSVGEDLTHLFPDEPTGSRFLYVEVEMPYRILFVGQILDADSEDKESLMIRQALKWPVRKGMRKKSRYPEVMLPTGDACETT